MINSIVERHKKAKEAGRWVDVDMSYAVQEIERLNATNKELVLNATHYAERSDKLREAAQWLVDAYDRANPIRQAVLHAVDCRCVQCARDNAGSILRDIQEYDDE